MIDDPVLFNVSGFAATFDTFSKVVVPNGQAVQLVVPADGDRTMLRVYNKTGGALVGLLLPDQETIRALGAGITVPAPLEFKYKDAPDWCTMDLWGAGTDATGWVYVQSRYQG